MTDLELDLERCQKALATSERRNERRHEILVNKQKELMALLTAYTKASEDFRKFKPDRFAPDHVNYDKRESLRRDANHVMELLENAILNMVVDNL